MLYWARSHFLNPPISIVILILYVVKTLAQMWAESFFSHYDIKFINQISYWLKMAYAFVVFQVDFNQYTRAINNYINLLLHRWLCKFHLQHGSIMCWYNSWYLKACNFSYIDRWILSYSRLHIHSLRAITVAVCILNCATEICQ